MQQWSREQEAFLQQQRSAMEQHMKGLIQKEEQLEADRRQWEQEKVELGKLVNASDVLELNVGGCIFTAKRSTLCQGDTLLSAMFSGRWDDSGFARDNMGRIYLDFDSECFSVALQWLRNRVLDPSLACPPGPQGRIANYNVMIEYLQLNDLLWFPLQEETHALDLKCAQVVSWSSLAGTLGDCPSNVFNESPGQGWASQCSMYGIVSDPEPWIVVDLGEMIHVKEFRLHFRNKRAPSKVCLLLGDSAHGEWHVASGVDLPREASDAVLVAKHCGRFFRFVFQIAETNFVSLTQITAI
jgi:hypothetical protein